MNAGKSTTLLQSAHNYEERGMSVMLFTPNVDDREGVGTISSRIGLRREVIGFGGECDLFEVIRQQQATCKTDCVLVDEAQFLTPTQVLQLTMVCDQLDIPVLCYGIRTDFKGEPFPGSKYLLAWAEDLIEIKTVCRTGKKATMNARLDADGNPVVEGDQIDIGHHYIALSRREFDLPSKTPVPYDRTDKTSPAE